MTEERIIPLFPLGIVALPGAPIPLHIFEERYKEMISRCIEQGRVFGIVLFSGERMADAGCTVRVLEVLKRYDDGRMDILTREIERIIGGNGHPPEDLRQKVGRIESNPADE